MENMIAAYETQRVHGSMIDAIVAQEVERQLAVERAAEAARIEALTQEIKRLNAMLELHVARDTRLYTAMIAEADKRYALPKEGRLRKAVSDMLWGAVCMVVEAVDALTSAIAG